MVINSPRGTSDIIGEDIAYRNFILAVSREIFRLFKYSEIITPAFENTEVFSKSIGEGTDIVQKEMYTFSDRKGRSMTLRPEGTASVVRAVTEKKLYSEKIPLKLFYIGNMFRYERPQKGRMREFWQLGAESFGEEGPFIDAEIVWILNMLFERLGFKNLVLYLNSIGCGKCRPDFVKSFSEYLRPEEENLCTDCRERLDINPLRIFDCKKEGCRNIVKDSPQIADFLCRECRNHFREVIGYLEIIGINYEIKSSLVRGFDYYTKTIFEMVSLDLNSAQNALGGGGRYDRLVSQFGGPEMPAIGFAVGIDRTIMLMRGLGIPVSDRDSGPEIYITTMDPLYNAFMVEILKFLRGSGFPCEIDYKNKNIKSAIKSAEKNNCNFIVIIGEDEVKNRKITVKNLKAFEQFSFNIDEDKNKIIDLLRSI